MRALEIDQLLVTHMLHVRYLTGFTGTSGAALLGHDNALFFTDFRYTSQAAQQVASFEVIDWSDGPQKTLNGRLKGKIGFDELNMPVAQYRRLEKDLGEGSTLAEAGKIVTELRQVKDELEIKAISEAAARADRIFETLCNEGIAGRTERDVAWKIGQLAHDLNCEGLSFPPIVATGAHGASPHAEPRDVVIPKNQMVVLDLGVICDGYCSDATRTVATGDPTARQRDIYDIVLRAQEAALVAVAPGATGEAIDAVARDQITAAGFGDQFGHSLGHGVGLEIHEEPRLAKKATHELRSGEIVTIEPGIYIEGEFGVRIEDLVVVEELGAKRLSHFTKELLAVD